MSPNKFTSIPRYWKITKQNVFLLNQLHNIEIHMIGLKWVQNAFCRKKKDQWGIFSSLIFYYLFECSLAPPWIGSSRGQWWRDGGGRWKYLQISDLMGNWSWGFCLKKRKVLNRDERSDGKCFVYSRPKVMFFFLQKLILKNSKI